MSPVIEGRKLGLSFGVTRVLDGVDIAVDCGEIVALLGPSGSGKSTLLHCLASLLRPDAGEVIFDGGRIDNLSERERSRIRLRHMGFVFQHGDLIPELTLRENVELPMRLAGTRRAAARERAEMWFERLGIAEVADHRVMEVSGGEVQRAAVARALVHAPALVLADEPTGSLDTRAGEAVMEALVEAARETGTAVLLVTHDLRVASYAGREVLLRDGRVVSPAEARV